MNARAFFGSFGVALLLNGCHRKTTNDEPPKRPAPIAKTLDATLPSALAPFAWSPLEDLGSIGLPQGCILKPPVQKAPLPRGAVRFVTPAGSSRLIVAVDEDGDGVVDWDGVLDDRGRPGERVPWQELDAPPIFAKSDAGWVVFDVEDGGNGARSVVVRHPSGLIEPLVTGDHLDLADATCTGKTCAVLTSLAAISAGPGATVLIGGADARASEWKRTDVPPADGLAPFSIVRLKDTTTTVATSTPAGVSIWGLSAGSAKAVGHIASPFGVYDVVLGDAPIAVAPGSSIDTKCVEDGFTVRMLTSGGSHFDIDGQVPPSNVLTRPLETGFFVGWLAPISCRHESRETVRAFLIGQDGAPRSSTMAVADARGFAVATQGSTVDVWLATREDLIWVTADCRPGPPSPGPGVR